MPMINNFKLLWNFSISMILNQVYLCLDLSFRTQEKLMIKSFLNDFPLKLCDVP